VNSSPVLMWGKRFALSFDAIAVPVNPLMQSREVEFYLANTGAKALSGSSTFAAAAVGDVCL
jgi:acyl-CoA synthetase (AMP-forming)/AMP-acid ligase II